ncbi:Carboxypeptidase regulatory-like domain-containing protein [Sulfidibacter corallicola]|uniref:Carboxypeptidase regulatory-like domain-containing protein n=1 Tax=Sulfidibacter corallicola TaxID=2818388 RepID=A0A8A4TJZ8_SULCO|nr:carboxypeptidase regulatory-like domain-containing protein [Sulfidibacter corallicola]QTD49472.1 carboxypeptidase regulatory-like domain-containing protein [Sulfidibacter corallicola]
MRLRFGFLLLLSALVGHPDALMSQSDPLAETRFVFERQGLRLSPENQTILVNPEGPAVVLEMRYDGAVPQGAEFRGELSGPGLAAPVALNAPATAAFLSAGRDLFVEKGRYEIRNVRLTLGEETLAFAEPRQAIVEAIDDFIVTEAAVRPLTAEDLAELGYLFNEDDYEVFEFTFSLLTGSRRETMDVQAAFPKPKPNSENPIGSRPFKITNPFNEAGFRLAFPTYLEGGGFTRPAIEGGVEPDSIWPLTPALILVPGHFSYLKDHFEVTALVMNRAPRGASVHLERMMATVTLPDPDAFGLPLTIRHSRSKPMVHPGADGEAGTGDDRDRIGPGEDAGTGFVLRAEREGSYEIVLNMSGEVDFEGSRNRFESEAETTVHIKSPAYSVVFDHPDTVESDQRYELRMHLTNDATVPLSGFSVTLPPESLVGCERVEGDPTQTFSTVPPGATATVAYRLRALYTGSVQAGYFRVKDGPSGALTLRAGVGDPDSQSPTSLVFPQTFNLFPLELRHDLRQLAQAALNLSFQSPERLPSGQLPINAAAAQSLARTFAMAGFARAAGSEESEALARLFATWVRAGGNYLPIDQLRRRRIQQGISSAEAAFATAFSQAFPDNKRLGIDAVRAIALENDESPNQFGLLVKSDQPFELSARNEAGQILHSDGRRDLPFGTMLTFSERERLVWVAVNDATPIVDIHPTQGGRIEVSGVFPRNGSRDLFTFSAAPQNVGTRLRLSFDPDVGRIRLERDDNPATTLPAQILGAKPFALRHVAQASPENLGPSDPSGKNVVFHFSKSVDLGSIYPLQEHLFINDQPVHLARIQPDRRTIVARAQMPLGPFVPISYRIEGITSRDGERLHDLEGTFDGSTYYKGIRVIGRVTDPDTEDFSGGMAIYPRTQRVGYDLTTPLAPDGSYSFDFIPVNVRRLLHEQRVRPLFLWVRLADRRGRGASFTPRSNGQVIRVDFAFDRQADITGTVFHNGRPAPFVDVYATNQETTGNAGRTTTDAEGRYRIDNLSVGPILVKAGGIGALGMTSGYLTAHNSPLTIDVDIVTAPARISGQITFADGAGNAQPLAGAQVYHVVLGSPFLVGPQDITYNSFTRTDADGFFRLEDAVAGQGLISILHGHLSGPARLPFNAEPGENTFNHTFPHSPPPRFAGTLRGRVTYADGRPARYGLSLLSFGNITGYTNIDGTYEIRFLPLDTDIKVFFEQPSTESGPSLTRNVRIPSEAPVQQLDVVLPGTQRLSGILRNGAGEPMAFVPIRAVNLTPPNPPSFRVETETAIDGTWSVETDQPGKWLIVAADWPRVAQLQVTVTDHPISGLALHQRGVGGFAVRLVDGNGEPIVGRVDIESIRPRTSGADFGSPTLTRSHRVYTDAQGQARFDDLNHGPFTVQGFHHLLGETAVFEGVLDNAEHRDIVLSFPSAEQADLFGTVFDSEGLPVSGALVQISRALEGSPTLLSVRTNEAGQYRFTDLIDQRGHTVQLIGLDTDSGDFTAVQALLPSGVSFRQDLVLRGRSNLNIRVEGAEGNPVDYATVGLAYDQIRIVEEEPGNPHVYLLPMSAGDLEIGVVRAGEPHYRVEGVPTGRILLRAIAGNGLIAKRSFVVPDSGEEIDLTLNLESASNIRGSFLDESGQPLPNALVKLFQRSALLEQQLTQPDTGETPGRFGFTDWPMGAYRLLGIDPFTARQGSLEVRTSPYQPDLDILLRPDVTADLFGRVLQGEEPVPGARITLVSQDGATLYTGTDAEGAYRLPDLRTGRYEIQASDNLTGRTAHVFLTFDAGSGNLERDLLLEPPIDLRIRLLERDETPVTGAQVTIARDIRNEETFIEGGTTGSTDGNGELRLRGMTSGLYVLHGTHPDGSRLYETFVLERGGGDSVALDFTFPGYGTISGRILDAQGAPLAGAHRVYLQNHTRRYGDFSRAISTFNQGDFRFTRIPLFEDFVVATYHPDTREIAFAAVRLEQHNETRSVTLQLGPTTFLSGTVREANGSPAAFAHVWLPDPPTRAYQADSQGRFFIEPVERGSFSVRARERDGPRTGLAQATVEVDENGVPQPIRDLEIRLSGGSRIEGLVSYDDGSPITSGTAQLEYRNVARGNRLERISTAIQADGRFGFPFIPWRTYQVRAFDAKSKRYSATTEIELTQDNETLDLQIQFPPDFALAGNLLATNGIEPIIGGTVELHRMVALPGAYTDTEFYYLAASTETDNTGGFQLDRVFPGEYLLKAYSAGHTGRLETLIEMPARDDHRELRLTPTAIVVGTVRDAAGQLFDRGTVSLHRGEVFEVAHIQADGAFVFENQPIGPVRLSAHVSTNMLHHSQDHTLVAGLNPIDIVTPRVITLTGRVVVVDPNPRNATVSLRMDRGTISRQLGNDGRFALEAIPAGRPFTLSVSAGAGYREFTYEGFQEDRDLGDFHFDPSPPELTFAQSGATISSLPFTLSFTTAEPTEYSEVDPSRTSITVNGHDITGRFTHDGNGGSATFNLLPEGFVIGNNQITLIVANTSKVRTRQTHTLTLDVSERGLVLRLFDGPYPAVGQAQVGNRAPVASDGQGTVEIGGLASGRYPVKAWSNDNPVGLRTTVELGEEPRTEALLRMAPVAGYLGRVLDLAGDPVAAAEIQWDAFVERSDAQGAYMMDLIPLGRPQDLVARAPALVGYVRAPALTEAGDTTAVDIQLEATGTVGGQVLAYGSDEPVVGADVTLTLPGLPAIFEQTAVSDEQGRFRLVEVMARTFEVAARDPVSGATGAAQGRISTAGETVEITVRLQPTGTVSGLVSFDEEPATGATISVSGTRATSVTADANGHFALEDLPYGRYELVIEDRTRFGYHESTFELDRDTLDLGVRQLSLDAPPAIVDIAPAFNPVDPLQPQRMVFSLSDARALAHWRLTLSGLASRFYSGQTDRTSLNHQVFLNLGPNLEPGTVAWRFEVEDAIGQVVSREGQFTVALDSVPPTVAISEPLDGATLFESESVVLRFAAEDLLGLSELHLYVNDALHTSGNANTRELTFSPPDVTEPTPFQLRVEAVDRRGNRGSASISVTVEPIDTEGAPELSLITPQNNQPLPLFLPEGLNLTIRARLSDPDGLGAWRLLVEDTEVANGVASGSEAQIEAETTVPEAWRDRETLTVRLEASDLGGARGIARATLVNLNGEVLRDLDLGSGDPSLEGQSVILLGTNNLIQGRHSFENLVLVNGAVLSQPPTDRGQSNVAHTELLIERHLVVDASSRIDLGGKGYPTWPNALNLSVGHAGHAGLADDVDNDTEVYGSPIEPTTGGSLFGGGALKLTADSIWLDGEIRADGRSESGGEPFGSGGSIWLEATTWSGQGMVSANGFPDDQATVRGGSGGRIAIHGPFEGILSARGATGCGHGTLFHSVADPGQADGRLNRLTIEGGPSRSQSISNRTLLPGQAGLVVGEQIEVSEHVVANQTFQVLTLAVTETVTDPETGEVVTRPHRLAFGAYPGLQVVNRDRPATTGSIYRQDGDQLWSRPDQPFGTFQTGDVVDIVLPIDRLIVRQAARVDLRGNARFAIALENASLRGRHGRIDTTPGLALGADASLSGDLLFDNLVLDDTASTRLTGNIQARTIDYSSGDHVLSGTVAVDSVTIGAPATVATPSDPASPLDFRVREFTLAGTLVSREAGSRFETSDPRRPNHGGLAAGVGPGAVTHGSLYFADSWGFAGRIAIDAEESVAIDGHLDVDQQGRGAGSIFIQTPLLTGQGRLSADATSGGAGRIAVHASDLDGFTGTMSARATQTGGGAGTVFLRSARWPLGKLILDNGTTEAGPGSTPLPGLGLRTATDGASEDRIRIDPEAETPFPQSLAGLYLEVEGQEPALISANTEAALTPATTFPSLTPGQSYGGLHRFNVVELRNGHLATPDRVEITDELVLQGGSIRARNVAYPTGFALRDGALEIFEDLGIPDLVLENFRLTSHVPLDLDSLTLRNGAALVYHHPVQVGSVTLDGATLTAALADENQSLAADSVTLRNGSVWNVADRDGSGVRYGLRVAITNALSVDATSVITSGGATKVDPTPFAWAGQSPFNRWGHGGFGRLRQDTDGQWIDHPVFGSFAEPTRTGGANGGGAIRIQAGSLALNGRLDADGHTNGAGGSIWLTAPQISGSGILSVAGNNAAGGRIAIYHGGDTTFLNGLQVVLGEDNSSRVRNNHGAGTLYLKGPDQQYGDLIVDQRFTGEPFNKTERRRLTGVSGGPPIIMPATDSDTDNRRLLRVPGNLLPPDLAGLLLAFTHENQAYRTRITASDDETLTLAGDIPKPLPAGTRLAFVLALDRLELRNGAQLGFPGRIEVAELTLEGSQVNSIWAEDLNIVSEPFALQRQKLRLILAEPQWQSRDLVLIDSDLLFDLPIEVRDITLENSTLRHSSIERAHRPFRAALNVTARRIQGSGVSAFDVSETIDWSFADTNHGGLGTISQETYGSPLYPESYGSGNGAGGALHLTAEAIEGVAFRADGDSGAGGSIWIEAGTLTGDLTASANGGSGGGGRIAVRYDRLDDGELTTTAYGRRSAGTVVVQDRTHQNHGTLRIANDRTHADPITPIPGFATQTLPTGVQSTPGGDGDHLLNVPNLTLAESHRGYYLVVNGDTAHTPRILTTEPWQSGTRFTLSAAPPTANPGDRMQPALRFDAIDIDENCQGCTLAPGDVLVLAQPRLDRVEVAPLVDGKLLPGQPFTMSAEASGNTGLVSATATFEGVTRNIEGAGPYLFEFEAPSPGEETTLTAQLSFTDAAGAIGTYPVSVTVAAPDRQPPELAFATPADGADIFRAVPFTTEIRADDNHLIQRIEATFDGETQSRIFAEEEQTTSAQASFTWNGPDLDQNQTYAITARAFDPSGNVGIAEIRVNYRNEDRTGPSVQLSAPVNFFAHDGEGLTVTAVAEDASGMDRVEITFDGQTRTLTTTPYTTHFTIDAAVSGDAVQREIAVRAFDNLGNETPLTHMLTIVPPQQSLFSVRQELPVSGAEVESFETVPFLFQVYALYQDFELGLGRWRDEDPTGNGWRPWSADRADPGEGQTSWRLEGDREYGQSRLVSEVFTVPPQSFLRFRHSGSFDRRDDGLIVEIKPVGSDTWTILGPRSTSGPADRITDSRNPIYNQYAFTESWSWQEYSLSLFNYSGQVVQVAWHFYGDASVRSSPNRYQLDAVRVTCEGACGVTELTLDDGTHPPQTQLFSDDIRFHQVPGTTNRRPFTIEGIATGANGITSRLQASLQLVPDRTGPAIEMVAPVPFELVDSGEARTFEASITDVSPWHHPVQIRDEIWVATTLSGNPTQCSWSTSGSDRWYGHKGESEPDGHAELVIGPLALPPLEARIRFHSLVSRYNPANPSDSGGFLEISVDDGATWFEAAPYLIADAYDGPFTGADPDFLERPCWFQNNVERDPTFDLSTFNGRDIHLKFIVRGTSTDDFDWFVSDLTLFGALPHRASGVLDAAFSIGGTPVTLTQAPYAGTLAAPVVSTTSVTPMTVTARDGRNNRTTHEVPLVLIPGDAVQSDGLDLGADDTAMEDASLVLTSGDHVIDGTHRFASLTLLPGATLRQSPTRDAAHPALTDLRVDGALRIFEGALIDVSGAGYPAGQAHPDAATTDSHGHGGLGAGEERGSYGDIAQPASVGSNGGGGHVRLRAASLHLDGEIRADGILANGRFGSGGTIVLEATTAITGAGSAQANGFSGSFASAPGGGGGRLRISAPDLSGFTGSLNAFGGFEAGAGTVYREDRDGTYVDVFGRSQENPNLTELGGLEADPPTGLNTRHAHITLTDPLSTTRFRFENSRITFATGDTEVDLRQRTQADRSRILGTLFIDSELISPAARNDAHVQLVGDIRAESLTLDRDMGFAGTLTAENLALVSGSQSGQGSRLYAPEDLPNEPMIFHIANQLRIEDFASAIEALNGAGYRGNRFAHGGEAMTASGIGSDRPYGNLYRPNRPGGLGGVIEIHADSLMLEGKIRVGLDDPRYDDLHFLGSGGSILIDVGRIEGYGGYLIAKGSSRVTNVAPEVTPSGGRIALHVREPDGDQFFGTLSVEGGTVNAASNFALLSAGAAGTIFRVNDRYPNGHLTIPWMEEMSDRDLPFTSLVSLGRRTAGTDDTDGDTTLRDPGQAFPEDLAGRFLILRDEPPVRITDNSADTITGDTGFATMNTGDNYHGRHVFNALTVASNFRSADEIVTEQFEHQGGELDIDNFTPPATKRLSNWRQVLKEVPRAERLIIDGGTRVRLDKPANFRHLVLEDGAVLEVTAVGNAVIPTLTAHRIDLRGGSRLSADHIRVNGSVTVDETSVIEGAGVQTPLEWPVGHLWENPNLPGSYGGEGVASDGRANPVFGSMTRPFRSGDGRKSVRLTCAELLLDGHLTGSADPWSHLSNGAVRLETNILRGSGRISANAEGLAAELGQGGGRIAVTFATRDRWRGSIEAFGAPAESVTRRTEAGAGTIFLKGTRAKQGHLIIAGRGHAGRTPLVSLGVRQLAADDLDGDNILQPGGSLPPGLTGSTLVVPVEGGTRRVKIIDNDTRRLVLAQPLPPLAAGTELRAELHLDRLELRGGVHLVSADHLVIHQDILFDENPQQAVHLEVAGLFLPERIWQPQGTLHLDVGTGLEETHLVIDSGTTLSIGPRVVLGGITVSERGELELPTGALEGTVLAIGDLTLQGRHYQLPALRTKGRIFLQNASLDVAHLLEAKNLSLANGSHVSHPPRPLSYRSPLFIHIRDTLAIDAESSIALDGLGWQVPRGDKRFHAHHGGLAIPPEIPRLYDSPVWPSLPGGGERGGGSVVIRAGQVRLDGRISARGVGLSAGGSICLVAREISGLGRIDVLGGHDQDKAGGGGRVALHLLVANRFAGQIATGAAPHHGSLYLADPSGVRLLHQLGMPLHEAPPPVFTLPHATLSGADLRPSGRDPSGRFLYVCEHQASLTDYVGLGLQGTGGEALLQAVTPLEPGKWQLHLNAEIPRSDTYHWFLPVTVEAITAPGTVPAVAQ